MMTSLRRLACVMVLAGVGGWLHADDGPEGAKTAPKKVTRPPAVTPEREAAAMTFVTQHYPELSELLVYLKHNPERSDEYSRAVGDLFRTSERLAQYHGRDPERYELELGLWKVKSRIEVIAARLQMNDTDDLRRKLRAALQEQVDLRKELLADRISKLQEQVERLDRDAEKDIDRQFRTLTRETANAKRRVQNNKEKSAQGATGAADRGSKPPGGKTP